MENIKKYIRKFDFVIILIMTILICTGLFCLRQIDLLSYENKGLFTKQLLGVLIGLVTILGILFIDYRFICKLSYIMYIGTVLILTYLLVFGDPINYVKRWIVIAGTQFQPSELTKIVLILFLANICSNYKNKLDKMYMFVILTVLTAIPVILIVKEPHLSSGISILFIFCIIVYSSGISFKVIGTVFALVIPLTAAIIISVAVFHVKLPLIKSYHINRMITFLSSDEEDDAAGKYQQNQAIVAIAAGGRQGELVSNDVSIKKYSNIYANESDFIFSVVGEEFGFIGSTVIIFLYLILILRCLMMASHAPDQKGKLICIGVSALLAFQVFANIGVAIDLLPNTGLPLPFISNGLTSLIISMMAIGLVLNIGLRRKDVTPV